jgi:hypothetical protein
MHEQPREFKISDDRITLRRVESHILALYLALVEHYPNVDVGSEELLALVTFRELELKESIRFEGYILALRQHCPNVTITSESFVAFANDAHCLGSRRRRWQWTSFQCRLIARVASWLTLHD